MHMPLQLSTGGLVLHGGMNYASGSPTRLDLDVHCLTCMSHVEIVLMIAIDSKQTWPLSPTTLLHS